MRALKGLVRLQALVRGHIERKKWAKRFQRFQAILRAQARARVGRAQISELSHSHSSSQSSQFHQPVRKFCFSLRCVSNSFEVLFFWTLSVGTNSVQLWKALSAYMYFSVHACMKLKRVLFGRNYKSFIKLDV